tara:strand:+ start:171 stop:749 length:579 start_codon:yes stop_codon:yes gene_type:complete
MAEELIFPPGRVGVFLSGGADSALLLYLLALQNNHEIVLLTVTSEDKNHQLQAAMNVVKWISNKTDATILKHRVVNAPSLDKRQPMRNNAVRELTTEYEIKTWVSGKTLNPDVTLPYNDERKLDRDSLLQKWDSTHTFCNPFNSINKKTVKLLADKYEIGRLISSTVSCENSNPPCKKCWWCEERKWAFGEY